MPYQKIKLIFIFIATIFSLNHAVSQDFTFFDFSLNKEKLTLCQAMEKYGINDKDAFHYIQIGQRLHSLVVQYDHKIFSNHSYVLLRDTVDTSQFWLNQIGLSSKMFSVTNTHFKRILDETHQLINQFKLKYGEPTKYVDNEDRYFGQKNEGIAGDIVAITWDCNNVKLKITFAKEGEHGVYHYHLRVDKFQDYLGNMKLPKWWNGY